MPDRRDQGHDEPDEDPTAPLAGPSYPYAVQHMLETPLGREELAGIDPGVADAKAFSENLKRRAIAEEEKDLAPRRRLVGRDVTQSEAVDEEKGAEAEVTDANDVVCGHPSSPLGPVAAVAAGSGE